LTEKENLQRAFLLTSNKVSPSAICI
jgi:hypothetical protein